MTATVPLESSKSLEDLLAYLPISNTRKYAKGQRIYSQHDLTASLYLVVSGAVAISQITSDGGEVLLEIVRPEEMFGESALLDVARRSEQASAIEPSTVMTWPVSDLEDLITKRPRLALALLQVLAQRNVEFTQRITSFATDTIEQRLARSLIRFSERMGTPEADGSTRMRPFTHRLLSRYVGTSREIITQYMNRFRKQGHVSYSRHGISLYCDTLRTVLD